MCCCLVLAGLLQCPRSTSHWTTAWRTRSSSLSRTTQPPTLRQRVWTSSPFTAEAPGKTLTSARWSTTLGTKTCKQVTLHLAGRCLGVMQPQSLQQDATIISISRAAFLALLAAVWPPDCELCFVSLNCFMKSPPPELFFPTSLYQSMVIFDE